jgi:hypothetical protein
MSRGGDGRGKQKAEKNKLKPVFHNTKSTITISILIYLYRISHAAGKCAVSFIKHVSLSVQAETAFHTSCMAKLCKTKVPTSAPARH